jgi:hypothetical protein
VDSGLLISFIYLRAEPKGPGEKKNYKGHTNVKLHDCMDVIFGNTRDLVNRTAVQNLVLIN